MARVLPHRVVKTREDAARNDRALADAEGNGSGPGPDPDPGSCSPSGPAGGALAGTYPNPDLNSAIAGEGLSFASNVLSVDGSGGILTSKGDLLSHNGSEARLPVGTDTHVLTADSSQPLGLKWAEGSGPSPEPGVVYAARVWRNVNMGGSNLRELPTFQLSSTWETVDMNVLILNEGGMVDTSTAVVTIQKDGVYQVSGTGYFTTTGWAQLRIIKQNDEGLTELEAVGGINGVSSPILNASAAAVELKAGDVIDLQVRAESGTLISVNQLPNLSIALVEGVGPAGPPGPSGTGAVYSETVGDGSATSFTINHDLDTRDLVLSVREDASPYHGVEVDWEATTTDSVGIDFLTPPASGSMRATIIASGGGSTPGPSRVTELPSNPSDGDEVYYAVDPGYWHLTYVDADERWNFVGGPPLFGADEANRDIGGGGGYNEWKIVPPGCAVEIPLFGEYLCAHDGEYKFGQGEAAYQIMMSYANTVRFSVGQETRAEKPALGEAVTMEGKGLRELLPGEDVFLMQYVSNNPENTWGNIRNRSITARPNWVMKEVPDGWVQGQLRDLALKKVEEANPVLKAI